MNRVVTGVASSLVSGLVVGYVFQNYALGVGSFSAVMAYGAYSDTALRSIYGSLFMYLKTRFCATEKPATRRKMTRLSGQHVHRHRVVVAPEEPST